MSKRLKVATANHVSRVVSLLWNYAVLVGHIEAVPFHVKPLKHQKTPRPTLSAFKVTEFLSAVDRRTRNPQIRVLIRAMIGLGLRESEALGMRWEWMDPDRRIYTVGKAKGKEARVLPVPAWVWNAIQAMPKNLSPWVFPNKVGGVHRPQYCKPTLKRVCEELKLGNITQHRLRATFATLHAEAGTPITDIQNMLGHKDIATTMIYVEQSMESKRRAQDALSLKLGLA
ncbi:MAG TPA: site-specific integrase [Candidatus Cloacimonadota bacterium]|nr:site-specific integrase [Candidatus Cloacimonadota bacterium]